MQMTPKGIPPSQESLIEVPTFASPWVLDPPLTTFLASPLWPECTPSCFSPLLSSPQPYSPVVATSGQ